MNKEETIKTLNNQNIELGGDLSIAKDKLSKTEYLLELKQQELGRYKNIVDECLQSVCCIEHNLDKYEEIGLDHFDYARKKTTELKEYLIEELKGE